MIFELVDTQNDHVERELRAAIAALQPDGVILTPPHSDNPLIVGLLDQQKIPFARIGSRGGAAGIALTMDDEGSARRATRSEEHTSELQSLMRISYAVFCLKKKKTITECR